MAMALTMKSHRKVQWYHFAHMWAGGGRGLFGLPFPLQTHLHSLTGAFSVMQWPLAPGAECLCKKMWCHNFLEIHECVVKSNNSRSCSVATWLHFPNEKQFLVWLLP